MSRAEHTVRTASDLYEARRAAKFLLGASYTETLKPYQHFIARVMLEERLPVLRAALKIGLSIPPADGIPLMCVMAAAVEMMESATKPDAVDPVGGRGTEGPRATESFEG